MSFKQRESGRQWARAEEVVCRFTVVRWWTVVLLSLMCVYGGGSISLHTHTADQTKPHNKCHYSFVREKGCEYVVS